MESASVDSGRINNDRPLAGNERDSALFPQGRRKRSFSLSFSYFSLFFPPSGDSFREETRKRHVIRLLGDSFLPRIFHDVNGARVCGTSPLTAPIQDPLSLLLSFFLPSFWLLSPTSFLSRRHRIASRRETREYSLDFSMSRDFILAPTYSPGRFPPYALSGSPTRSGAAMMYTLQCYPAR